MPAAQQAAQLAGRLAAASLVLSFSHFAFYVSMRSCIRLQLRREIQFAKSVVRSCFRCAQRASALCALRLFLQDLRLCSDSVETWQVVDSHLFLFL